MKRTEHLIKWDKEHLLHGVTPIGENLAKIFETGMGATLQDTEGKKYIDCSSHLVCVNLGYGQGEIIAAAAEQMQKLPYSTLFFGYSNVPSIECGQKLAELTPEGLDHFFFTTGGSDSAEAAFKLARLYWHSKGTGKYKIISLYDSYHGTHFGSLSATGLGKGHLEEGVIQKVPGFIHIPPFYCYRCMLGQEYPQCGLQCARFLAEVIEKEGPQTVAAFIAEPVMGATGMIPPPPEYWPIVREICTRYDVLLIVDEVMTGFCRTGKMFAVEHWGIKPDIMIMAKGITSAYLPLGAVALSERVYEGLKGAVPSSYTYSGHPVCCAAAVKAMEIYVRDNIADNAAKVGEHVLNRLNTEFTELYCVGEATGLGLQIGIEIVADKESKRVFDPELRILDRVRNRALEKGLFIRVSSIATAISDRIDFTPPLTMTVGEANKALDILKPILADL